MLVAAFTKNVGQSASFDPGAIRQLLLPALHVMAELVSLDESLRQTGGRLDEIESELSLVYAVDRKLHGASRRHAGLAELVGQSGRYLSVGYSVLLLPGKRIRISATHSSWRAVNRRAVDKYVVETLLPDLDGRGGPTVYQVATMEGSEQPVDQGCQALLSPLVDARGNLEGVIAQFGRTDDKPFDERHKQLMAHIARKVEYVIEQSFDPMTGLMNRAGFEDQLREAAQLRASPDDAHQIIYFDLDNLQLVNDTFGQDAGDQVIMRFARVIESALPRSAVATRLTGDDFAVLLPQAPLDDALALANEVRDHSDQLRYLQGSKSLQITVSIGISAMDAGKEPGDALTAARIACDAAKDRGRDRIEIHDQDDQSLIRRYDDMQLVTHIQRTLDDDAFILLAQPIVSAADPTRTPRYEILIRMNDARGNQVASGSLISAAERYHLMPHIDRWVISTTLRAIADQTSNLSEQGVTFAINLSGQSLGDDEMLRFIEDELDSSGIPTELLCFEITESAAVSNLQKAQHFINDLRERGCRFALDDFGAGLSSFAYLKNLEVDTLKIDGSFIRGITGDRIAQSMVAAITQVAQVMNLQTVAEYVSDAATQKLLQSLGVDYLQGHGVGRPTELEGVLDRIARSRKSA
ncbi:MAG: EAL domain-containing protein [Woeseiaceae bacterium]|nr:EAL domain-containing protein [Woeseiaceae bacterium]